MASEAYIPLTFLMLTRGAGQFLIHSFQSRFELDFERQQYFSLAIQNQIKYV